MIMKFKILFLAFFLAGVQTGAQNIVKLSHEVCDSINSVYTGRGNVKVASQFNIQYDVLRSHPDLFSGDTTKADLERINKFLHDIVQQLSRSCPVYKLEHTFLAGETSILDLEKLFTIGQIDSLQMEVAGLRKNKDFGLLIVSVDDLYPYANIKDYAIGQGYVWSIGSGLSKGGIVVVFSKKLKKVRISTSSLSKQFLPDEEAQKLIDKILLPKFSRGQYYEAMIDLVKQLEAQL
jgi:uncharacterized protein